MFLGLLSMYPAESISMCCIVTTLPLSNSIMLFNDLDESDDKEDKHDEDDDDEDLFWQANPRSRG